MAWIVWIAVSCQKTRPCQAAAQSSTVPVVRFLEIGDRGLVFSDAPATADVEISAGEPFEGELRAILRCTPDWKVTPSVSDQCIVPVTLARNERHRVQLLFPRSTANPREEILVGIGIPAYAKTNLGLHVDIVWKLVDSGGRQTAAGREKAEQDSAGIRVLNLTSEAGSGFRRAPVEAFTQPLRYQPYQVVIIGAKELVSLGDRQQQSLLDAVASGLTLVVSGGFGPLGSRWDGILDGSEAIRWKAGASEIREARFFSGRLRRTNISLGAFAALQEPEDPRFFPYALATSPEDLVPASNAAWTGYFWDFWRTVALRSRAVSLATIGITIGLLVPGLLLFIWRSSRPERPLGQFSTLFGAACILAFPPLMYAVLSRHPAGNVDVMSSVRFHDPKARWDRVDEIQRAGGGGGARVPTLALEGGASKVFVVEGPGGPMYRPWTTARQVGSDYELRLESPVFAGRNLVILRSSAIVRADPVWNSSLSWERGRPVGSILFKKAFRRAALVFRNGALRLGRISADTVVDVGRVAISHLEEFRPPSEPDEDSDSGMYWRGIWSRWVPARGERIPRSAITLIGEEEARFVAASRARPATCPQVHVEKVGAPEADADTTKVIDVPAFQRGLEIHAAVPDVIPGVVFRYNGSEPVKLLTTSGFREFIFPAQSPFRISDYGYFARTDLPARSFSITIEISPEKRK